MKQFSALRMIRQSLGMSQCELARRAGIRQPLVSELETGRLFPGEEISKRLADALGVPPEVLFNGPAAAEDNDD